MRNRLSTLACTRRSGPGATNMVTGAALATINRLPVLLLPGDMFATRVAEPGAAGARGPASLRRLGQRRVPAGVALLRPDQPPRAARRRRCSAAMRVLTDPAETGAVTLALPQDVQAEAYDWPEELFERARLARRAGRRREPAALAGPPSCCAAARRPLIVAGGGVDLRRGDRRAARARRGDRHPGRRDAGRQGLAALRPPAVARRDRRHRHDGRQRARPRGRRRARRRHALERLHDRVAQRCSPTDGVRFVNLNVARVRRAKHAGLAARRPTPAPALEALRRRARGLGGRPDDYRAGAPRWPRDVGRDGRARLHARPRARCRRRPR